MKSIKFLFTFCFLINSFVIFGQSGPPNNFGCGFQGLDSIVLISDPNYLSRVIANEIAIQDTAIAHHTDSLFARFDDIEMGSVLIPVVFHNIGISYITPQTAQTFINSLNSIFNNAINANSGIGVDTQIQFCLAVLDPNGNPTNGVTTDNGPGTSGPFCLYNANDDATIKSFVSWETKNYLNIWVCDLSGCIVDAWGSKPSMYFQNSNANIKKRDGVVCDFNLFNQVPSRDKTIAHEIAHWLNLLHTYGDGLAACAAPLNDDGCSDTPWCTGTNNAGGINCLPHPPSCNNSSILRQIENYMDDSNDNCKNRFTAEQKNRMHNCIAIIRSEINDYTGRTKCLSECQIQVNNGGANCGLKCPPCPPAPPVCSPTVGFKINGQTCGQTSKFINVCNNGVITLTAWNYDPGYYECTGAKFKTNRVRRCTEHKEENWNICHFSTTKQEWCCDYEILFISVLECDENKNPIASEIMAWVNMPQNVNIQAFNLYTFLPVIGASLTDGKLYRIRIASGGPWTTWDGYIKVFESNLTLTNKTIPIDEYADNLTYNGCTVLSNIKSVAQNQITVTGESDLKSGTYSIGVYNCTQLPSFRTMQNPGNNSNLGAVTSYSYQSVASNDVVSETSIKNNNSKVIKNIQIFPNPNDGVFKIKTVGAENLVKKLVVFNSLGQTVFENNSFTEQELELNLTNIPNGLYTVKVVCGNITHITRLIKE